MLGGGGRMLVGGLGRMLGGTGRDTPRTGGGGGVPDGRGSGVAVPPAGRGGSDTGRGGCAAERGGTEGGAAGTAAEAGDSLAGAARFTLSLALPCSSLIGQPLKPRTSSIARRKPDFVPETTAAGAKSAQGGRESFKESRALRGTAPLRAPRASGIRRAKEEIDAPFRTWSRLR